MEVICEHWFLSSFTHRLTHSWYDMKAMVNLAQPRSIEVINISYLHHRYNPINSYVIYSQCIFIATGTLYGISVSSVPYRSASLSKVDSTKFKPTTHSKVGVYRVLRDQRHICYKGHSQHWIVHFRADHVANEYRPHSDEFKTRVHVRGYEITFFDGRCEFQIVR